LVSGFESARLTLGLAQAKAGGSEVNRKICFSSSHIHVREWRFEEKVFHELGEGIGFTRDAGARMVWQRSMKLACNQMKALAFVLWGMCVPALGVTNGPTSYSVRVWQTEDGLPQNSVYALIQTPDDYLWVGTREGLARFDGVRFTLPDEKAAPELRHGWITALCVGRDGSLWIGVDGSGVTRMKQGKYFRLTEADGLLSNQIKCLLEGADGSIWIGSDGGVTRWREGKLTSFTEKNGLAANAVKGMCEDREGNIRIATIRGLSRLDKEGNISTYNFAIGLTANALKFVCVDRHGVLWIGSNEGLYSLQGEKQVSYGVSEGLPDRIVHSAYEDRAGQLWVGTHRGPVRMVEGQMLPRSNSQQLASDWIYAIFEDREGNIWLGAEDGLYRLNPARFTTYTTQQGLTHNNVMSVLQDRLGTIWIGTSGGGLNQMKGNEIGAFGRPGGVTHSEVLSLDEGRDGSLWVGMDHSGGLNRFKDNARNLFPRQPGLIDAAVRVIHEDKQGWLWIGTRRGLNILKDGKFETYTPSAGLAGNDVTAICEAADGSCWIGTDTGLSCWREGKFTNFTTHQGLSANYVNALYQDSNHTLWIGTRGGGLNRYRAGKFSAYTTREGLFSDEVYEIVEDDFGNFWMSCRKGIFRVSKREFDDLDRGESKVLSCTAFGKADGLASVQCNGVSKPAGWKSRDGRLWFPTIHGIVAVDSTIKPNPRPPPVLIEEVIADKRPVQSPKPSLQDRDTSLVETAVLDAVTIPPGHGELEVRYTALSFEAPEKNRFRYMLEGVDSGWEDAGAERVARYNNITPGRYRFRVTACNNDGLWNESGATLAVVFQPHYWQTWWFRPAIVAALGLLLAMFYRTRVARLRALEALRIEIAANLHDDVGSRLTKVAMVTEQVEREIPASDQRKALVQNIASTTREVIQAMDEIVWTINPKNDTLDHLANYIFQYAQEYFQDTGVRCRLDVPPRLPDQPVSTEERHNLFMAVKEALNNVLKHAAATEVRVALAVADGRLSVVIADNGCGFQPDRPNSTGNGLQNMRQRLERIGGRLVLESMPGEGTKIRMEANGR
jgi:ligand-binding sensor domain-containing protein/two-component sensor histidine kinase